MDIIEINLGQPIELQWAFSNTQKTILKTYIISDNINGILYEYSDEDIYVILDSETIVAKEGTRIVSPTQDTIYEITTENFFGKKLIKVIQAKILPQPTYSSLSINTGIPGDSVTVNGTNFPLNPLEINVKFLGLNNTYVSAVITSNNESSITFNVPNNVLSGPIIIEFNGFSLITDEFLINQIDTIICDTNLASLYNTHIEGTSFVHNDLVFVLAGGNNYLDIYDPKTNALNSAESSALFRSGFPFIAKFNNNVFLLGGRDQYNNTQKYIEKFDLASLNWSVIDTGVYFPFDKNGTNRSASQINDKLYIFTDDETLVFNLNTENFENSLSPLPKSPILSKAVAFNNYVYIFGFDSGASFIYKFDPITNIFSDITNTFNLDIRRCDLSVLNDRILITGSESNELLIKVFNPNTDSFDDNINVSLPIPGKKKNHTSQVVNGQLYLLGGNSNQIVKITPILF